jgi:hypothetical protein
LISPTKYTKFPHNIPNSHKIYQIRTKYTKLPQNIPNYYKIYQITTKIPNGHKIQIPKCSTFLFFTIYQNWQFWYELYTFWQHCSNLLSSPPCHVSC